MEVGSKSNGLDENNIIVIILQNTVDYYLFSFTILIKFIGVGASNHVDYDLKNNNFVKYDDFYLVIVNAKI